MAGMFLGALGGAGQEAAKFGGRMQQGAIDADLENLRSENLQNRTIALEKARIAMGNQEREAGVARVNQAQTGLVNQARAEKLNQFYGEGSNLRPEDISDEEMASPDAKLSDAETGNLRTKAAISTGDISPKDAATQGQKDAANEIKSLMIEAQNARTQALYDSAMARAEAMEARAKAASGGGSVSREERLRYTTLFTDAGRRLSETRKTLSTLQKSPLFAVNSKNEGTAEYLQKQEMESAIKNYEEERSMWQSMLSGSVSEGSPSKGSSKSAENEDANSAAPTMPSKSSGNAPAGLPAGSRKIGTSGGKDVYQAPDGKRYISQ